MGNEVEMLNNKNLQCNEDISRKNAINVTFELDDIGAFGANYQFFRNGNESYVIQFTLDAYELSDRIAKAKGEDAGELSAASKLNKFADRITATLPSLGWELAEERDSPNDQLKREINVYIEGGDPQTAIKPLLQTMKTIYKHTFARNYTNQKNEGHTR